MGYQDIFSLVQDAITKALSGGSVQFLPIGLSLWGIFATVIVLFFGIEWMFSPSSMSGSRVVRLIIQLLICKTVLLCYLVPIIGGYSFTGVIMGEANWITNTIGQANYDALSLQTTALTIAVPAGSVANFNESLVFILCVGTAELIKALIFCIASFGFIVQAILLLLGPLFIPFYIVPQLDFLAWNWFKTFLQYSFYGVIGNAYAYILGIVAVAMEQQIVTFIQQPGNDVFTAIGGLFVVLLLAVFGVFQIPSIVSHLFTGASGSAGGAAVAAAAATTAVKAAL
jgi:hypothetical protein